MVAGAEVHIDYHRSPAELDHMEAEAAAFAREHAPDADIVGLVVPWNADLANLGRTTEQTTFTGLGEEYDFAKGMLPHETRSDFLYTLDQREQAEGRDGSSHILTPRIVHVKRVVRPVHNVTADRTGIEMIDDRLRADPEKFPEEHADLEALLDHSQLTLDGLRKTLCVATNFTTRRDRDGRENGARLGQWGTLASYHNLVKLAVGRGVRTIMSYQNRAAVVSLGAVGAEMRQLGGRPYHLPGTDGATYDGGYEAYVIPDSDQNLDLFLGKAGPIAMLKNAFNVQLLEYPTGNHLEVNVAAAESTQAAS